MIGRRLLSMLLTAILPRGARPPVEAPPEPVPGVYVKNRRRGGSSGHKLVCAALRVMPTYGCSADRNRAKRLRKARRS